MTFTKSPLRKLENSLRSLISLILISRSKIRYYDLRSLDQIKILLIQVNFIDFHLMLFAGSICETTAYTYGPRSQKLTVTLICSPRSGNFWGINLFNLGTSENRIKTIYLYFSKDILFRGTFEGTCFLHTHMFFFISLHLANVAF